jgi:urease accessory protein
VQGWKKSLRRSCPFEALIQGKVMVMATTTIIMTSTIITTTDSTSALLRLMAWLSPAFPVGSFSYSLGLERAVHDGQVSDAATLKDWLDAVLRYGSGWNDAVLLAASWREATEERLPSEVAELAEALAGSSERHRETMLQGAAFLSAARAWPHSLVEQLPVDCAYPVSVGAVAGAHGVALQATLAAFLQAFISNQLQAAIRLSVIGQNDAVRLIASFEPEVTEIAEKAAHSTLDDLGSATFVAEIASMKHETQYSRLFRT